MPELPVKEVRLSELHLPEIKRDEIVRSLSEIHLPSIDLPKVERPRLERPPALGKRIDWRAIDPTSIDIGKALAGVAAAARVGRPVFRRSRVTIVVGALALVGLAAAALLSNPAMRERAGRTVRGVRTRMESRAGSADVLEVDEDRIVGPDAVADGEDTPQITPIEANMPAPAPEEVASPA